MKPSHDRGGECGPPVNRFIPLFLGVCAVSTGAVFVRLADACPLVVAAYRVGIAACVLAVPAWWTARKEFRSLAAADLGLALASGFFLALHFAAWITSLSYTSVANSLVLVNTNPLWVGLLAPLVTGERIDRAVALCIAMSIAGVAVIGFGDATAGDHAVLGDGLALLGGVCMACYLLLGARLRRTLSLLPYVVLCYGCAAALLWTVVVALGLKAAGFEAHTTAALWSLALISQLIGHTCYNWGLKWFSTSMVAVSLLGEPICGTVLAYFVFGEGLNWSKAVGGVLILCAIYLTGAHEHAAR